MGGSDAERPMIQQRIWKTCLTQRRKGAKAGRQTNFIFSAASLRPCVFALNAI